MSDLRAADIRKTPWEMAEYWYSDSELQNTLTNRHARQDLMDRIPKDTHSDEFIKWLAHQYRLAMAKGIELERRREDHTPLTATGFRELSGSDSVRIGGDVRLDWVFDLSCVRLSTANTFIELRNITTVGRFNTLLGLLTGKERG